MPKDISTPGSIFHSNHALCLKDALESARKATGALNAAYWIVEAVTGYDRSGIMLRGQTVLPASQSGLLYTLLARIEAGEPLQYVLGTWGFRGLDIHCDRRALIPRPETEQVVDVALEKLGKMPGDDLLVADLGTGSGAIALAIAVEGDPLVDGRVLRVVATDISRDALELAAENLEYTVGSRPEIAGTVMFRQGSWYDALDRGDRGRLSLIVSNPPYLSHSQWVGLDVMVSGYEPEVALVGGGDGLECLRVLIGGAMQWLSEKGCMVLEIDPSQEKAVAEMAVGVGFGRVQILDDLCGRPRVCVAERH